MLRRRWRASVLPPSASPAAWPPTAGFGRPGPTPPWPRPAYPVGCTPGDNLVLHVAVTKAPKGSVLVVDVGQVAGPGYWGAALTTAARPRPGRFPPSMAPCATWAALEAHGFPVFSVDHRPHRGLQGQAGHGRPSRCGSAGSRCQRGTGSWPTWTASPSCRVRPWTMCWPRGPDRETKEAGFFEALKAGSTTVGLLGLDASLSARARAGSARTLGWHNAALSEETAAIGREGRAHGGGAHDPG